MKKRNTTAGTLQNPRPYKVWKEHFIEEHHCERTRLYSELIISGIPHILLNLLLIAYLFAGALLFRFFELNVPCDTVGKMLFFCFTTIATIGYGDIVPTSEAGKVFCLAYCFVGVPLIFMVLANDGQFIVDAYWIFRNSYQRGTEEWDGEMPLRITFYLLAFHCLLGGFVFSYLADGELSFFDATYFSFISISTIGFGDIVVQPKDSLQTAILVVYLGVGMIYLSTLTGSLSKCLERIHYMGRQFAGVSDVEVWFGGEAMTVKELITIVAEECHTSAETLHYVLNDLDHILEVAYNGDTEEAVEHLKKQQETAKTNSFVNMEHGVKTGRKVTVARLEYFEISTSEEDPPEVAEIPSSSSSSEEEPTCSTVIVSNVQSASATPSPAVSPMSTDSYGFRRSQSSRVSKDSTPISKVPSNSSIHEAVQRESSASLHALGVVYHAIQKRESVRRSLSFRKQRATIYENTRRKSLLPAYPAVV